MTYFIDVETWVVANNVRQCTAHCAATKDYECHGFTYDETENICRFTYSEWKEDTPEPTGIEQRHCKRVADGQNMETLYSCRM